ncbi:MAG TPA: ROK family protein [Anaerolineaceae bacterium]|nr:ROK family protein [Anaerolineaceae bacterium]
MASLSLVSPAIFPPLDPGFRPASLANRHFRRRVGAAGLPVVLGLEREDGRISRYATSIFSAEHPDAQENLPYIERLVKFLLWQRGGFRLYVGGPAELAVQLSAIYALRGPRHFDADFMGNQVYQRPFEVVAVNPDEVPPASEQGRAIGRHLNGCRIGFDLGASDRKVSAVQEGRVIYSEEVIWEPKIHADPAYHYHEVLAAIQSAAARLPRVDAIGGSSAGIYIDNRPMVASLFRAVPPEQYDQIRTLFVRLSDEVGVPIQVINDGDVTALAGAMSLEENGILGIAMGSSEAAGYVNADGHILGWLNELSFAPVDYAPNAPAEEWSGDSGCGSQYFSQQCVFRLAPQAGICIPSGITDAEKLQAVQALLESGHSGARQIWQSMGVYLGYALAHYADFYTMRHVLILGRCTSGSGGEIILQTARQVLATEFPDLDGAFQIQLPDEKSRRVGQSIAAASLPEIQS